MNLVIAIMCLFAGLAAFSTAILYSNPFIALLAVGVMALGGHLINKEI